MYQDAEVSFTGILFGLASGLSYTSYVYSSKVLFEQSRPIGTNGLVFLLSSVILGIFIIIGEYTITVTLGNIIGYIYLGLFATGLAYMFFSIGLKKNDSNVVILFSVLEPITASIIALIVFKETVTTIGLVGLITCIIGLYVVSFKRDKKLLEPNLLWSSKNYVLSTQKGRGLKRDKVDTDKTGVPTGF